jgi:TPR repeat protein
MRHVLVAILVSFLSIGCATNKTVLFGEMESLAKGGSPEAQYHLGMFYNNGIGIPKDTAKALEWFEKSAMSGDPLGNYKLGCYYAGQGQGVVAIDNTKALEYKLVAAQHGYAFAQYDVASAYYENGEIEEAIKWWKESADQGDSGSIYALYALYSNGDKLPKDNVFAYGYLKIIERNSEKERKAAINEKLNELENEMSISQLEQAQEFATNWSAQKTPLTVKALNGLEESKRIVEIANEE